MVFYMVIITAYKNARGQSFMANAFLEMPYIRNEEENLAKAQKAKDEAEMVNNNE